MSTPPDASISMPRSPSLQGGESGDIAQWLDVPRLLAHSLPRSGPGGWGSAIVFLPPLGLLAIISAMVLLVLSPGRSVWMAVTALILLGVSVGVMLILARLAKSARAERARVNEIEELITLRHFPAAVGRLTALLGRPMRLMHNRLGALVQLARVLARYERFDDAVTVADAVLRDPLADPALRFAVGCGRAMTLLRADRLFDAGEAISSLRREVSRLDEAVKRAAEQAESDESDESEQAEEEQPDRPADQPAFDSAALTIIELYRDIQTRHSEEALAIFNEKRTALRDQLGIRFGDALALTAVAAHRLHQAEQAATLWGDATALIPATELLRRYPELFEAANAYAATPRPADSAGPTDGGPS